MIKSKDEILASITARIGDDTSDDAISLLEDVTDTLEEYERKTNDQTNWEQKYNDNDKMWREKYKERFLSDAETGKESSEDFGDNESENSPKTFEDLFTTVK